ncbi:DUF1000-domain-containing protein [Mycena maculata]|uniref:DUF1000-domain-containing protein n=1 Tax=Mycena maculata TaxID=230809 RepID=A0AAD7I4K0_9AGAR|nr:DUF1000-domain-containing protein [Mycena maculata]
MATSKDEVSLLELLDLSQLQCLDESDEHTLRSIVSEKKMNTSSNYLLSDVDAELLLTIPFNQSVKVSSLVIKASVFEQAPKDLKLFVNDPTIGFETVDEPVAEVEIGKDEGEDLETLKKGLQQGLRINLQQGRRIKVKFSKLQTVTSLHIFVASNQGGGDETRIDAIDVLGFTPETTKDLSGLKNVEDH